MKRPRILVVEDEPDLQELVRHNLARERYDVVTAGDGETALREAHRRIPDLVVLDLMLPGIDGLEVCRRLRTDPRTSSVPIVMLTAKGEETDAVIGLAQGADDYVRKPFGVKELVARVSARLRAAEVRRTDEGRKVSHYGDLTVDSLKHEVTVKGRAVELTVTEFKLLRHLVLNPGRAFTRNELLDAVLGPDAFVIDRNVDVHVATLRRKLGPFGKNIQTIRGLGYKLREAPAGAV
ncbi:MAG: response regulator [Planctomycetaceae bacterium]|nr:response regulator [Planctomycetota bacterium]NUN51841.1 response regulator [Planctomycetaceae bacterium]